MKARPRLRLRACRAARKFVRRRAVRPRGGQWLPIALWWRHVREGATARRDAMRGGVRAGAMHVQMHVRYAHQIVSVGRVRGSRLASRASRLPPRASQAASRASTLPTRPVLRELHSTSTSSSSHATLVRGERNQTRRLFLEHRSIRHIDHDQTHRVFREHQAAWRALRDETHLVWRESRDIRIGRAPQPAVGARVIAALRAQAVPMLRSVSRSIDATGSRHNGRRKSAVNPRVSGSHRTRQSQRTEVSVTQPPLAFPQSMPRPLDMVWRAPTPAMPASTATPTTSARTPASTIDSIVESASSARIENLPDTQHVRAAVRAQVLDPALVERLTDDVIRRIERRARIERERRGL